MPIPTSLLASEPADFDLEVTAGAWPADLTGEMVISGPLPDTALPHGFFGFGLMNRLSLEPGRHGAPAGRLAWRSHVIDSPSRRLFERRPELFTPGPTGYTTPFGPPNMANTAPLPWGDRLFATWDVGRPSELDPVSLRWLGDVGTLDAWGGQSLELGSVLPFLFTCAHPVVDPDRDCLWTVKLVPDMARNFAQVPEVIRWDRDGDAGEAKRWPVAGAEVAGSMHTISQTQHWLILSDSGNFKADPVAILGGDKSVSIDAEVSLYLVRKEELDRTPPGQPVTAVPFRLAPPTGHYYGQWDDTAGVRVIFEHMDLLDLGFPIASTDLDRNGEPVDPGLAGFYAMGLGPSTLSEATIDPTSSKLTDVATVREDWSWSLQLSAMDWCTEGLSRPTLHHVVYHGCRPGAITRRALDYYADRVDESAIPTQDTPGMLVSFERGSLEARSTWEFRDTSDLATSPTFAPRGAPAGRYAGPNPGGHDGYVIVPVLNDAGFRVEVFDAARVGAGPVAVASAPAGRTVPVLLHSAWMPRVVDAVDADRMSFASELTPERLAPVDASLVPLLHEVADELA